jgi:hypothetical protein
MSKDTTLLSVPAKTLSTGSREKLLRRSAADFSGWWCVFHVGHGGGPNRCNARRVALWARSPRTIFTKSRPDQGFVTSTRSAVIRSASPSPQCNCTRRRQFVGTGSCACKCRIRRFSHREPSTGSQTPDSEPADHILGHLQFSVPTTSSEEKRLRPQGRQDR